MAEAAGMRLQARCRHETFLLTLAAAGFAGTQAGAIGAEGPAGPDAVVKAEFVYESAPFPQCHASTIVETDRGLVAGWFGGTAERNPDVGIWLARHDGKVWSAPMEVVNGVQGGERFPCWNPVLFQ